MARTSQTITQAEVDAFDKFCAEHNIVCDSFDRGVANGNLLGGIIQNTWQMDITAQTLQSAYDQVRDRVSHYSPAETRLNALRLSQDDLNALEQFIRRSPNLNSDTEDNLRTNAATIGSYMLQQRLPIHTVDNNILTRMAQLSTQSYPLIWRTRPQDSDKKTEHETSSHEQEIIKNRAESVVVRTPSGLVNNSKTAIVREIVAKDPSGKIDWRKTLVLRERAAQN
jgi:hypothetical protein